MNAPVPSKETRTKTTILSPVQRGIAMSLCILLAYAAWQLYVFFNYRTVINVDGKTFLVQARQQSVQSLLQENNILLGEKDIVSPPLASPVPKGGIIRVMRVEENIQETTQTLPEERRTVIKTIDNVRTRVEEGIQKQLRRKIKIIFYDGQEKRRETIKDVTTEKTLYRVYDYYTKPRKK
jgi:uncharacterized protein YabE (DUF348 family)